MTLQHLSVGDIAVILPGATTVFRRHKIDFCCNGGALLSSEAERRGLDLTALETELRSLDTPGTAAPAETADLIAHIIERYHKVHRVEFPEAIRLARRVETVHQAKADCPRGLAELLTLMFDDLEDHQHKEEAVLFPAMVHGGTPTLRYPIAQMMQEHVELGEQLAFMADLTDDFTPPEGACNTWRALYAACSKLDTDLREHVHLENNILFQRFL
ncbi:iron-sulfur cluster repair di-iron protein [uncultured Brevundimonas sp.]|uniref:iron-sulfur cluster repair di-iron protein n=1 Tax=uncultured Brevundimonas sp. TaxID=213418 RepID=UPI0030EF4760|tara:strand:+ start:44497 stop:45141 length:645 start_codon:yes stop_codon:yes gene_type:complete